MTEPIIVCPQCKTEIKLTESLAAPLIESTRKDYEQRLAKKDADVAKRETALREQEEALAKQKDSINDQIAEKLRHERSKIAADEAKKATLAFSTDLEAKDKEVSERQDVLKPKRVQEGLNATREQARKEAEAGLKLKVLKKDQLIARAGNCRGVLLHAGRPR